MIRRNLTLPDGTPCWLLISQIDHARLSGELATAWGNQSVTPVICPPQGDDELVAVRREVLAAISHHDDGWAEWEAMPTIDSDHLRVPSFLEMPLDESLDIWRRSILTCAQIGPLAAWMVARHFIELRSGSDTQSPAATDWLHEMQARCPQWLADWQSRNRDLHTDSLANHALEWLRSLDVLSLWLCGGEGGPLPFPPLPDTGLPIAEPITFNIVGEPANNMQASIAVNPWPFHQLAVDLAVNALLVPVARYTSGDACLAGATRTDYRWRLVETHE